MTPALPPKGKQSSLCLCFALRSSQDFLCSCCSAETTPGPNLSSFLKPPGRQRGQRILLGMGARALLSKAWASPPTAWWDQLLPSRLCKASSCKGQQRLTARSCCPHCHPAVPSHGYEISTSMIWLLFDAPKAGQPHCGSVRLLRVDQQVVGNWFRMDLRFFYVLVERLG